MNEFTLFSNSAYHVKATSHLCQTQKYNKTKYQPQNIKSVGLRTRLTHFPCSTFSLVFYVKEFRFGHSNGKNTARNSVYTELIYVYLT